MSSQNYDEDGRRELASWIPTVIMLFCFPPVGVIMLIMKLFGASGRGKPNVGRHPYDIEREREQNGDWNQQGFQQQETVKRQAESVKPAAAKKNPGKKSYTTPLKMDRRLRGRGKSMMAWGGIAAVVFGLGGMVSLLENYNWFWSSLPEIFVPLGFAGAGLVAAYYGYLKNKKSKRFLKYLALIGRRDSISVTTLAQAMGVSVRKACDDLQDMLDEGLFPVGYLDMSTGRLVLNSEGLQEEPPKPKEEPPKAPAGMEREDALLMEIREVNDAIRDVDMSRKINRIGEISGKIFAYLRNKPDKEGQLRSFLSYYLPTTLKILRAYAQMEAQGIEGENITAAKVRIEGMMDKVVDGFEKQLDKLFQDDAMDITTDVEVLERMLDKDGLGGQEMTMGG